ncbi:MAG: hypothetical protein WCK39_05030 [Methanomassiliicoccales archaeon]
MAIMDVTSTLREEIAQALKLWPTGIIILDVKGVLMLRATIETARLLAANERGIIITIDRPHQYLMQALKAQEIPTSHLVVLDVIARYSADINEECRVCSVMDGPFNIDRAPEAVRAMSIVENSGTIDIASCSFILVDNMGALLPYNNLPKVESFVKGLAVLTKSGQQRRLVLMVDGERQLLLMEMLRSITAQRATMNAGRPPASEKR